MDKEYKNEYQADVITPPGETINDTIKALGMTQAELAGRTGRTSKAINELIKGKTFITPETAILLERSLGVPASFWNNRQRRYDEFLARKREIKRLKQDILWLKKFSYKMISEFGWVEKTNDKLTQLQNLLNFFGVGSITAYDDYWTKVHAQYRKSEKYQPDQYALSVWLRKGELTAQKIDCSPYNEEKFRSCLSDLRKLTAATSDIFQIKLIDTCSSCGVAVVFVRELPKTASGATRWITPQKAIIQLSFKYKTNDHLWFTFFHEAAHIVLHKKRNIFIESQEYESKEETEANKFAAEILIPSTSFKPFLGEKDFREKTILSYAQSIDIDPGIVVGRLQHMGILNWNSNCNNLKRKLNWAH